MRLRLATYNIHDCVGGDGHYAPQRVLEVLREIGADIVALQEVGSARVPGVDLLEELGRAMALTAVAGSTLLRATGCRFGNGVLTRLPVQQVKRVDITRPGREPRGAIVLELEQGGQPLQLIATHLGLNAAERRAQVRVLLTLLDTSSPLALLGDMNEWFPWGRPLRWLQARLHPMPSVPTFPAQAPMFALDRIWVHPRSALCNLRVHHSELAYFASDHLPLVADVQW